jgi:hypothetical protein
MRVVVTGLVATYPVGGVAWDYLQYLEGFRRIGCDVLYLEDTGLWGYDPVAGTFVPTLHAGVRYLQREIATWMPALDGAWAVVEPDGTSHGASAASIGAFCRSADLFLNVSGGGRLRDVYRPAGVAAFIDTDPCYNQARVAAVARGTVDPGMIDSVTNLARHDVFFTLGLNLGAADCTVPGTGITWLPTRQPVLRDVWEAPPAPGGAFTTVMSWRIEPVAPIVDGVVYGGKDVEFERLMALPAATREVLEVAVAGEAPRERMRAAGWRVLDARGVSASMRDYHAYVTASRGELSIAKNAYVAPRTGWFSTRSATYLASGRPTILQDTGFSAHLPTGAGLHAFANVAEAAEALDAVRRDFAGNCAAARDLAATWFDAETVCRQLLADALG